MISLLFDLVRNFFRSFNGPHKPKRIMPQRGLLSLSKALCCAGGAGTSASIGIALLKVEPRIVFAVFAASVLVSLEGVYARVKHGRRRDKGIQD